MRLHKALIPIGALTLAIGVGGSVAQGAQRDHEDRNGRQNQSDTRGHSRQRTDQRNAQRNDQRNTARDNRQDNRAVPAERHDDRRNEGWDRRDRRSNDVNRGGSFGVRGYVAPGPRYDIRRPSFNHRYGPGLSVFFGVGSGYRYGSLYSGRVYGYVPAPVYGARIYYGDVRLQVRPRDASVFVDGYYAGIVDDFDGIFQRLTLAVGPHEIEIEGPGLEPQVFNVMVDPSRTIDVRADLYPMNQ